MRRTVLIPFVIGLCFAAPVMARAQTPAPPTTTETAAAQAPAQPAAPATPAAGSESTRSLFAPTPREFLIGGRFSSVDGDQARFQRYQDMRDGLYFSGARYAIDAPEGDWAFRALADNVGWRDQRYAAGYERTGRFTVSGMWDQIPQFYSV